MSEKRDSEKGGDSLVGIIGTGRMGEAIAEKLISEGFKLKMYNRTPEKAQPLAQMGGQLVSSIEEFRNVPTAITMVSDDGALLDVAAGAGGLVEAMGVGGIHIAMSTVDPRTIRRLAQTHLDAGQWLVSAPVFGTPADVRGGEAVVCVGGHDRAKEAVRTVLQCVSKRVFDVGRMPERANLVKLTGNFMIASAIEALSEAYALAEKNGVSPETIAEIMCGTIFGGAVYGGYGSIMAENQYDKVGFTLRLALKDLSLIDDLSMRSRVPLPLANVVRERLLARMAKGSDDDDWATLALEARESAGLLR